MSRDVPIRLVLLGTVLSALADAWFAATALVDRVLAHCPWRLA